MAKERKSSKLGLALSGGGFRATAFHLGVLKRLRELGVLDQIKVISTVSGGSITGAFWAFWLARHPTTLDNDEEWDGFERALVAIMRGNLRGRIVAFCVPIPFLLGFILTYVVIAQWGTPLLEVLGLRYLIAAGGGGLSVYLAWRTFASRLLVRQYDRWLFHGADLHELANERERQKDAPHPELFINATALRSGRQIVFEESPRKVDVLWEGAKRLPLIGGVLTILERMSKARAPRADESRGAIHLSTDFGRAVAASSSVPGIFPPLKVGGPFDSAMQIMAQRFPKWFGRGKPNLEKRDGGDYLAVDGGVYDNQGAQALLDTDCTRIIISDAAAALRPAPNQSRRHVKVLARSQEIIYERVRAFGYAQLKLRHNMYRMLERVMSKHLSTKTMSRWRGELGTLVEGYCYIELLPARGFDYQKEMPYLPSELHRAVANIRTDLDRFSDIEISALMYHGYTLIDHCLQGYNKRWIPNKNEEAMFQCAVPEMQIDWPNLLAEEQAVYDNHLAASGSRFAVWRALRRSFGEALLWLANQPWWPGVAKLLVETWRTVSPGWKKSGYTATIQREGEPAETIESHTWKRQNWREILWRKTQGLAQKLWKALRKVIDNLKTPAEKNQTP